MAAAGELSLRGSDKKKRTEIAYFVQTHKSKISQNTEIKLNYRF